LEGKLFFSSTWS